MQRANSIHPDVVSRRLPSLLLFLILLFVSSRYGFAQKTGEESVSPSIHQEHQIEFGEKHREVEPGVTAASTALPSADSLCPLDHIVFGWHPYWQENAVARYVYPLLTDLSYFSYEVNPATGGYSDIHAWRTTALVDSAKANGRRVNLCVTLFSGHATLFGNPTAVTTLIDSLVSLVKLRDADGVNIDFEAVPSSQKNSLTDFMVRLGTRFHNEIPGSQISIALPAVDWSKTFDVVAMEPYVDLFIIMGYGYHYGGSTNAGPIAPKNSGSLWSPIDLTRSINYYLTTGIPADKLALGLPWYGYDWPTTGQQITASTRGTGSSRTYGAGRTFLEGKDVRWDSSSSTPWSAYQTGDSLWRQFWFDDERSLGKKYDLATMKGIAGIGIWALGYDGGYPEMWEALREAFSDCGQTPCSGELTDMGGSDGDYYSNDNWHYTIAPEGATTIDLRFNETFDLADDHLYVYNGFDSTAPLLADLTGNVSPGMIRAVGSAITLRFVSNSSVIAPGFVAEWECSTVPLSVEAEDGRNGQQLHNSDIAIEYRTSTDRSSRFLHFDCPDAGRTAMPTNMTAIVTWYTLDGRRIAEESHRLPSGEGEIQIGTTLSTEYSRPLLLTVQIGSVVKSFVVGR